MTFGFGGSGGLSGGIQATVAMPSPNPSWVPTTAWEWIDIPGTNWGLQVLDNGAGSSGAPAISNSALGANYTSCWDYSGPCYSRSKHEFWMFGGGHAGTTNNILTRYELGSNAPSVVMVSAPTSEATRTSEYLTNYTTFTSTTTGYHADGKPLSPHSYFNNLYRDSSDEFISFGLKHCATSTDGTSISGGSYSRYEVPACNRSGTWTSSYSDIPALSDSEGGGRALVSDGSAVYYWPSGEAMRKFVFGTNTYSTVGGPTTPRPSGTLAVSGDDTYTLHVTQSSDSGWGVETRALADGARQVVTVTESGFTLATGLTCYGVEWVESIGKFVACWINASAFNGGGVGAAISTIVLTSLTMTSASTATAAQITVATGDGAPNTCGSIRGMAFDPIYNCLLFCFSHAAVIKALKVS